MMILAVISHLKKSKAHRKRVEAFDILSHTAGAGPGLMSRKNDGAFSLA